MAIGQPPRRATVASLGVGHGVQLDPTGIRHDNCATETFHVSFLVLMILTYPFRVCVFLEQGNQ
jgi:hypothetical protein